MRHLTLFLLLNACGTYIPQIREVSPEVTNYAFGIAETEWNERLANYPFSFDDFDEPKVTFVDRWHEAIGKNRGVTNLNNFPIQIYVLYLDETDWESCVGLRYVLAHELLHYICMMSGYGTIAENISHMTQGVWTRFGGDGQTVEGDIFVETVAYCKEKWGDG